MDKRPVILSAIVIFGFVFVVVRLADLMLLNHKRFAEKARLQHTAKKDIAASRGEIYDRRGRQFAMNLDVDSIYCKPQEIASAEKTAALLAGYTGERYETLVGKLSSGKGFVWVSRKLEADLAGLKKLKQSGVGFIAEAKRFYPGGTLASHVVGFVGIDDQPLAGIELKYDENLKGKSAEVTMAKDAGGKRLSDGLDTERSGNGIVLNLDEGLQFIVEKALDKALSLWSAQSASAIMMDPFTGEILAMANRPNFDLNDPGRFSDDARRNRVITDTYEPGSTFKIVMAAAALESGVVGPENRFDCSAGSIKVGSMLIKDAHKKGVLTFREVIQASSNVGTVMAAQRVGPERLYRYARLLGFGETTGIDLPGEARGRMNPPEKWSGSTLAAMSIGYEVSATPLQVLRAYSAVANGGHLVKPHLLRGIITPDGRAVRFQAEKPRRAISAETASILKEILVSVTEEGGTAMGAAVEGNRVAGKTGTAKLLEGGKYGKKYASSFVGFVPADRPRVAVIVIVREPKGQYYGGLVAAPLFKEIAEQTLAYLNVPREDTFMENYLIVGGPEGARTMSSAAGGMN